MRMYAGSFGRGLAAGGWLLVLAGCGAPPGPKEEPRIERENPRVRAGAVVEDIAQIPKIEGPEPTEPVGAATTPLTSVERDRKAIADQIPDPAYALQVIPAMIAATKPSDKPILEDGLKRIETLRRPRQISLSLKDCIQSALRNSYPIRANAYNPAIQTTRIVEAEAQFDTIYFLSANYNNQDRPSSSQLQGNFTDTRAMGTGVRKLLSTGTQVAVSYANTRTYSDLVYQTLNPAYFNYLTFEMRQPFLRGFGLDFNRAQIELSKLDRRISLEQFSRDLQQTLFDVEQAYWQLKKARAEVVSLARLLASFERIYKIVEDRKDFDTFLIQRGQIRSRLETREAEFVSRKAAVRNAEDALKALVNDPKITLAEDVELVPTDEFSLDPVLIDRLGEVQAALDYRPELHEAKLQIEKARVGIGVAKNQALPKFDVVFRYLVDGLGGNWNNAFNQMTHNDFNEYYVGLEFEWPIGNRGPEAGVRRARLQEAQAIAAHAGQIERIIAEVHRAVRDLQTSYEQIGPVLRAAQATEDQLRATIARQAAKDPANLEVELNANESLAQSRSNLITVLVNYMVAIANLEQKKGTLLRYNGIEIRDPDAAKPVVADWVVPASTQP